MLERLVHHGPAHISFPPHRAAPPLLAVGRHPPPVMPPTASCATAVAAPPPLPPHCSTPHHSEKLLATIPFSSLRSTAARHLPPAQAQSRQPPVGCHPDTTSRRRDHLRPKLLMIHHCYRPLLLVPPLEMLLPLFPFLGHRSISRSSLMLPTPIGMLTDTPATSPPASRHPPSAMAAGCRYPPSRPLAIAIAGCSPELPPTRPPSLFLPPSHLREATVDSIMAACHPTRPHRRLSHPPCPSSLWMSAEPPAKPPSQPCSLHHLHARRHRHASSSMGATPGSHPAAMIQAIGPTISTIQFLVITAARSAMPLPSSDRVSLSAHRSLPAHRHGRPLPWLEIHQDPIMLSSAHLHAPKLLSPWLLQTTMKHHLLWPPIIVPPLSIFCSTIQFMAETPLPSFSMSPPFHC